MNNQVTPAQHHHHVHYLDRDGMVALHGSYPTVHRAKNARINLIDAMNAFRHERDEKPDEFARRQRELSSAVFVKRCPYEGPPECLACAGAMPDGGRPSLMTLDYSHLSADDFGRVFYRVEREAVRRWADMDSDILDADFLTREASRRAAATSNQEN